MNSQADIKPGLRKRSPGFLFRQISVAPLLLASLLFFPPPICADPPVFFHKKDITLQKISSRELGNAVDGSISIDEGAIDLQLSSSGSVLNDYDINPEGYTTTAVKRRIDELWEWKILKNKNDNKPYITAEYSITGANGQRSALSNQSDPSDSIDVQIEPLPLSWSEKNNQWICTGGIDLVLDLADISKSGNYAGTITTLISIASF
ncbi:MAG: hypothetical protein K9I59_03240 [Chlorobium sp.]|uniref:hypothetical protein n=1 Tax=Chlorobium sp. TaxID=1095 RepID=UPI0025BF7E4C|nr:hypothetical protein [Chlorobium sp.]MCF8215860.1 hypothetical protein [Chlorobium sp.]MCF8270758.1 hypothetical protein [Chlorobium sp.]MCF8287070.1 hypothetical protein [Chlorobium sp.]MCF8290727.1 hypothetical protein [Chlorobium sp.]MCF8384831.1 hypothetical protein [Chlorobium sp.]